MNAAHSAQAVLERLTRNASTTRAKALSIINEACLALRARGSCDFRTATVGRLSARLGGPSDTTLYNRTSKPYCELIAAHAAEARSLASHPNPPVIDAWSDVADVPIRARIRVLEDEVVASRRLAARAKSNLEAARSALHRTRFALHEARLEAVLPRLNALERTALIDAPSPVLLASLDVDIAPDGSVSTPSGQLFKPGFAAALTKIRAWFGLVSACDGPTLGTQS